MKKATTTKKNIDAVLDKAKELIKTQPEVTAAVLKGFDRVLDLWEQEIKLRRDKFEHDVKEAKVRAAEAKKWSEMPHTYSMPGIADFVGGTAEIIPPKTKVETV